MNRRHAAALVLFGIGDFILQVCFVVLGAVESPRSKSAFHFFRMLVLAPVDLVPVRVRALVPVFPPESASNTGLYTLLGMLLINTLIWMALFHFCLRAVLLISRRSG